MVPTHREMYRQAAYGRFVTVVAALTFACEDSPPSGPTNEHVVPAAPPIVQAPPIDPLASLRGCLGREVPLKVVGRMPYVEATILEDPPSRGYYVLDLGTNASYIDPTSFPTPGPGVAACRKPNSCAFDKFVLFGAPEPVSLIAADYASVSQKIRQSGLIGTDFTTTSVVTLSYGDERLFVADKTGFCRDELLGAAGFVALATDGFYSDQFAKLKLLPEVKDVPPGLAQESVPDIPTVPIRLMGVELPAQLDTGFDDRLVDYSVNVNTAWLDEVERTRPGALRRVAMEKPITLTTCVVGLAEQVERYETSSGEPLTLELRDRGGNTARVFAAAVFVKRPPREALHCAGIGTWKVPAAQIGASYFAALDVMMVDPFAAQVWVRKQGGAAPAR